MADRIKNYQQGADEIAILKDIRTTLGVTPSSYTPDATAVTRDRVVTFAQAEEELSVLGDIQTGMQQFVADTKFQVGANTGDIANIKALLQGQLYNYQTDSTEAYTKTVPAGALPYAGVEMLGGKTLVMNQLVQDGNFALGDTTYWKKQGTTSSTIAFADGVATVTLGGDSSVFNPAITQQSTAYIQAVQGHKYLIKVDAMADFTITGLYFSSPAMSGSFTIDHEAAKDTWINLSRIITAQADGRLFGYIGALGRSDIVQGSKLNFRNIFMVDLTLLYGAGNEPSTVEEFETMFPASYYPYNAGTLLCAGVTSVISKDSNDDALQTLSIPAEVQALEGYGWSAGSAYNYIDYERKVFVKRVGRVVLNGTQSIKIRNWRPQTNSAAWGYYPSLAGVKKDTLNILTIPLKTVSYGTIYSNDVSSIAASTDNNYSFFVRIADTSLTTDSTINAYMSANPITVYYELATPVETEISAYLTDDNLVQVEADGTVTIKNQNGDDYRIPVPSDVTYMIDLQAAINEGEE